MINGTAKGLCKVKIKKNEIAMEVGGCVQVPLEIVFFGKSSQNSPMPVVNYLVVYHVYFVCKYYQRLLLIMI